MADRFPSIEDIDAGRYNAPRTRIDILTKPQETQKSTPSLQAATFSSANEQPWATMQTSLRPIMHPHQVKVRE
jgi:hypothetical protein